MRRRVWALGLALVLALSLVPMGALAAGPMEISTAEQFAAMDASGSYILMDDISITTAYSNDFSGTFDGNGHRITVTISGASNVGLFKKVTGTVKNLIVDGTVTGTGQYVGAIAAVCEGRIIDCGNEATVTGNKRVGGIAGHIGSTSKSATILNCYNTGAIEGKAKSGTATGGIAGYVQNADTSIQNCASFASVTAQAQDGALVGYCQGKLTSSAWGGASSSMEAAGWINDANKDASTKSYEDAASACAALNATRGTNAEWIVSNGVPVLKLEQKGGASTDPEISIDNTAKTLYVQTGLGDKYPNEVTLTAKTVNVPEDATVSWSIDDETAATLTAPVGGGSNSIIVKAATGGTATVTASVTVAEKTYSATSIITVIPHITTLHIDGVLAVGETLTARADIFGGGEYDDENFPTLNFQWRSATEEQHRAGTYEDISGATGLTYTIPADMVGNYISISLRYGSENKTPNLTYGPVVSAAMGAAQKDASELYAAWEGKAIKAATMLSLPTTGTNGSAISWESSDPAIDAKTGKVTLPAEGKVEVELTAAITNGGETLTRTYTVTVWSQAEVDKEAADQKAQLEQTIQAKLGTFYKMYPVFGTDTNVVAMLKAALNDETIGVSIQSVTEVYGGAGIANDGTITYYYKDPNETAPVHFASYRVTFALTRDGATAEKEIPVIVYWDRTKVEKVLNDEILAKLDDDLAKGEDGSYVLPKTIDGKRWALISWTSSDDKALSISAEGQQTADTLFDPYVGVVRPGTTAKTVTLTAKATFQYTNDVTGSEAPIVLYKTFTVTVPPVNAEQGAAIEADLQAKLEAGFAKVGLTDDVTGETLTAGDDDAYTVTNDIQLPTTRDFGVDGKVQPVTLTTSDETGTLVVPSGSNAALVTVYRPAPGQAAVTTDFTVTLYDQDTSVSVSKTFTVKVLPLTQEEIERELALMSKVKAAYFDGIKNANTAADDIRTDLHAFQEVYERDGQLVWVYDSKDRTGSGIVPTAMKGWEELEAWRLFQSSNPAVVSHENLLVTRQKDPKRVNVTSSLSSETLGRYGALYASDKDAYAAYASCAGLYAQEVSAELLVRGTANANSTAAVRSTVSADFTLTWLDGETVFTESVTGQEPLTVYSVFKDAMEKHGYAYNSGSYVRWIESAEGETLSEMDAGPNSGWMYKVNGQIPDVSMQNYGLKDGDRIVFFYTKDYTKELYPSGSHWGGGSTATLPTEPTTTCPFTDLTGHWAKDEVERAWTQGLVTGMTEGTFVPDAGLTRAMAVTMLHRMAGAPAAAATTSFTDVPAGTWYAQAVAWAAETGVVKGMTEGTFAPDEAVTRAQLATMLYRYAQTRGEGYTGAWMFLLDVPDRAAIADWAYEAVCWLNTNDVLKGRDDGRIDPQGGATRAEAAALYLRLADKLA